MIKIYPSRLEGEPLEQHKITERTTMAAWLAEHAPLCDASLLTLHKNGLPADLHTEFDGGDTVEVWVEPKGIGAMIAIAAISVAATMALMRPRVPKAQQQGQALRSASLEANSARYGEPIPEIFGRPPRIYPDYLLPPRTYYTDKKVQWFEALLCVGKGEFDKSIADVFVGDTRAAALGDDIELQFYEPNASLASQSAADWWHTPKEVGFTSRGGAGMELGTVSGRTSTLAAELFRVSGDILSIQDAATFPLDWGVGVEMRIEVPMPFAVTRGAPHDLLTTTNGLAHFTPVAGMQVELAGDIAGIYKVASYHPPASSQPANDGEASSITGTEAPLLDYEQAPKALLIEGTFNSVQIELDADFADDAELLAEVQNHLAGLPIAASFTQDGFLQLIELSPFSGLPITVSGSAALALFGTSYDSVTGDATTPEIPAQTAVITLNTLDDKPVTGLDTGAQDISIAPAGLLYQIIGVPNTKARQVKLLGVDTWHGWPNSTSDEIDVMLSGASAQIGWTGPFTVTPQGEKTNRIEVDYQFPSGLIHHNKKGKRRNASMGVVISWRIGNGDWQQTTRMHTLQEPDGIGFTHAIALDDWHEDVQVRVRTDREPNDHSRTQSTVHWSGLRGRLQGAPARYEGVTTLAVRLRTGDRVSSQSNNQIWLKATRKLPLLDGTFGATRDIAPALLHVLTASGFGGNIDTDTLEDLHEIWQPREDFFDFAAVSHSTIKRTANDILRAGFAELTIDNGQLTAVRDAKRDAPNYIYSPQEFIDYPTVTTELIKIDEVDGVDVEYIDEHTGQPETIKYRMLGEEGLRAEKIKLVGVTNRTRAWRIAARHRRTLAYRRTSFKGTTELHALNSSYMSFDRIQDGVPEYGQSCFVTAVDGLVIHVSEPLDFDGNANRVIALRQPDGRVTRPVWVKAGPVPESVELLEPLPFAFDWSLGGAVDPTMLYFGSVRTWAHDVLVTAISPRQDNMVNIDAVVYDDRVYADDDRGPRNEVYLTTEVYAPDEVTSTLYPLEHSDRYGVTPLAPKTRFLPTGMGEDVYGVQPLAPSVFIRTLVRHLEYRSTPEAYSVQPLAPSVAIQTLVHYLTYENEPDAYSVAPLAPSVQLSTKVAYIDYEDRPEIYSVTPLAPTVRITTNED